MFQTRINTEYLITFNKHCFINDLLKELEKIPKDASLDTIVEEFENDRSMGGLIFSTIGELKNE